MLSAAVFLLMLAYVLYTYPPGTSGVSPLFYGVPVFGAAVCIGLLRSPELARVNVALVLVSMGFAVYAAELFLTLKSGGGQAAGATAGRPFDKRSKLEVVQDLRWQGTEAFPAALPSFFMQSDVLGSLLPLGGVANTTTVLCNELGEYAVYQSDEHGFNNPAGLWSAGSLDVAVVGDSFTHGSCVPPGKDLVSRIRERWPRTLSLGMSDNGPLLELAAIREYLSALRPEKVLWMYFEGNDLSDLARESKNPRLRRYLEDGYRQGLVRKQPQIDSSLASWIEAEARTGSDTAAVAPNGAPSRAGKLRNIITLQNVRRALNLVANPPLSDAGCDLPTFRRVLSEAKETVSSWGGQLYFVYLPSWGRYHSSLNQCEQLRDQVLSTVASLSIPIIDLHPTFANRRDRSVLFAQGASYATHYNVDGYNLVAQTITNSLQATRSAPNVSPQSSQGSR